MSAAITTASAAAMSSAVSTSFAPTEPCVSTFIVCPRCLGGAPETLGGHERVGDPCRARRDADEQLAGPGDRRGDRQRRGRGDDAGLLGLDLVGRVTSGDGDGANRVGDDPGGVADRLGRGHRMHRLADEAFGVDVDVGGDDHRVGLVDRVRVEAFGDALGALGLDVDVMSHHPRLALQRLGGEMGVGHPGGARGHRDEAHVVSSCS